MVETARTKNELMKTFSTSSIMLSQGAMGSSFSRTMVPSVRTACSFFHLPAGIIFPKISNIHLARNAFLGIPRNYLLLVKDMSVSSLIPGKYMLALPPV